jgi:hypothetical protein
MKGPVALRWLVGALAVLAIAVVGVFANLAVLRSGSAEGSIGTLSAKGISQVDTNSMPPIVVPIPPEHRGPGHHDGDD